MIFTISVLGGTQGSQANLHAFNFAKAVVKAKHKIARVFFYQEGVSVALSTISIPTGEVNYSKAWQAFSSQHNIELAVCIASGSRRGIVDNKKDGEKVSSLADGFELVGLGQLTDAISNCDRYIEFSN